MELGVLDPFGDYETAGYLRNYFAEKDSSIIGRLETAAFESQIEPALRFLGRLVPVQYSDIKAVHRMLFDSVYPWAGQDRLGTEPRIRIWKSGHRDLFALPDSIGFAVEHALRLASDQSYMRAHPVRSSGILPMRTPFWREMGEPS